MSCMLGLASPASFALFSHKHEAMMARALQEEGSFIRSSRLSSGMLEVLMDAGAAGIQSGVMTQGHMSRRNKSAVHDV